MSPDDDLGHGDIEAALATRRELGARYDAELTLIGIVGVNAAHAWQSRSS